MSPASRPSALDRSLVASPDGKVQFELLWRDQSGLSYRITFKGKSVIEPSLMGIIVDGVALGQGVEAVRVDAYRVNERYAWRGVHSEAINYSNGAKISVLHKESKTRFAIDVRAFNDGVAFRYVVPGDDRQRVPDEATAFTIPAGSFVWYHDFEGHYEGTHARREISEVWAGEWAAPPLTIKLANGAGYGSITEAASINYSGMGLQADGRHFHLASGDESDAVRSRRRIRRSDSVANRHTASGYVRAA